MARSENHDADHIIDIERRSDTSSPGPVRRHDEERASSSSVLPFSQSFLASSNGVNSRNYSFTRRSEGYGRRSRSPFDSGIWISIELVVTLSQIIPSIIVLSLWRWKHENPQASLFAWVIGYAFGCVATLPLLYWRFLHRSQGTEQDSTQTRQDASQNNLPEPSPFADTSLLRSTDEEDRQTAVLSARSAQSIRTSARVNVLVVYRFKMALHYFLVTWITFGNGWTFGLGWHSPSADAPNFYRFCISFLKICCIGFSSLYAAYVAICCCLLGFQYYLNHTRGASTKTINALPTYKFKLKDRNGDNRDTNSGVGESGGTLEAGTKKERIISGEDAACCICLEKYADNEELRKLPCAHFFHVDCVDKWLKKNGSCPLCKCGIGKTNGNLPTSAVNSNQPSAPE